jgi:hypothetical protein
LVCLKQTPRANFVTLASGAFAPASKKAAVTAAGLNQATSSQIVAAAEIFKIF